MTRLLQWEWLSPIERFDYNRLNGRGSRLWGEICYYSVLSLFMLRLVGLMPPDFWRPVAYNSILFAGWIMFLAVPGISYSLIAKPVRDGTLEIETVIPVSRTGYIFGKYKVGILVLLRWTLPLFITGFIADPSMDYAVIKLSQFFKLREIGDRQLWSMMLVAFMYYAGIWVVVFFSSYALARRGHSLIELLGVALITILILLFVNVKAELYTNYSALRNPFDAGSGVIFNVLGLEAGLSMVFLLSFVNGLKR
ncbi:MAG TPA: hypothetical protein VGB30_08150 [bacterium]|jgi:hypothetical protein